MRDSGGLGILWVLYAVVLILVVAAHWKVFSKAGKPGWAAIVPIYNTLVQLEIIGKPWWWILLLLVPVANIIVAILMCIGLARSFGRGGGFAAGLILLPVIFLPILGFGSAKYVGPVS